jgi:DNA primase
MAELSAHVDLSSAEGRAALVHAAKPLVTRLQKNAFRVQIVRELAERARLDVGEVQALCGLGSVEKKKLTPATSLKRRGSPPLWKTLLRLMLDAPQLARDVTAEQRRLLESDTAFAPVLELADVAKTTPISTAGALFEALRGSAHAQLYAEIARDGLASPAEVEGARADFEGVMAKLELSSVEAQYRQLCGQTAISGEDRERLQAVSRRLAELKGAARVGVVPRA